MTRLTAAAFLLSLVGGPVIVAGAGTISHHEAGITIWYPDDWHGAAADDNIELHNGATPDESEGYVYIEVVEAADLPEVDRDVDATTAKWVRNVRWENDGKPTDRVVNGMRSRYWNGKGISQVGKLQGRRVELTVEYVSTPRGKVVVLYGDALEGGFISAKLVRDIEAILNRMTPSD